MQYLLLFLEGIITFVSPCFLPVLPVYISYFAGTGEMKDNHAKPLTNAIGFVLGFTGVFVALGAFAGSVGRILHEYSVAVNIVTGLVIVMFGLSYLGFLRLPRIFHRGVQKAPTGTNPATFFPAVIFGAVFSIGWTPCVSAFLGAALMRAAASGTMAAGMLMLFVFSLGLGLPLIASAVLIDRLKSTFDFIKRHYKVINIFAGGLLVAVGILVMTGVFGRFAALFVVGR